MPKTKEQKKKILENLQDKIKAAKSVIFTKFDGFSVKDNEELRKKLKAENSEYLVAKKTIFDLAFKDLKVENLSVKNLDGQVAAIFGYADEVAPAKIVNNFKKDKAGKIEFAGGILENKFIERDKVMALAQLPSKQELYAKIVGSINAPVSGFVNVLAGNLRNFVGVLKAISEKK